MLMPPCSFSLLPTHLLLFLFMLMNIIIMSSDSSLIQQLISKLESHFALKDLGQLSYFLRLEVHYTSSRLHLSQTKYIKDLFTHANILDCKSMSTLISFNPTLSLYDGQLLDDLASYRSVVGALKYCTLTRLDISLSVNKVCQFMHKPTIAHWQAVKRILHYLKAFCSYGIFFQVSPTISYNINVD